MTVESNEATRMTDEQFQCIADIAESRMGLHLPKSKMKLVETRIRKHMEQLGKNTLQDYLKLMQNADWDNQFDGLVSALTTNVTNFFREDHHFEMIEKEFLERLINVAKSGSRVRIWSAGCSTGQEPYSLAMRLSRVFPDIASYDVKILATDIDSSALKKAKEGRYSKTQISSIPENLIREYFTEKDQWYDVCTKIKNSIQFAQLNLIAEFPMKGKFDIIMCRNVLIYFDKRQQAQVWSKLRSRLNQNGLLFIGHAERISSSEERGLIPVGVTAYRYGNNV